MRRHLIHTQTRREPNPAFKPILLHQRPRPILDHLRNLRHRHSRLDILLSVLSDLTMYLSCAADRGVCCLGVFVRETLEFFLLGGGYAGCGTEKVNELAVLARLKDGGVAHSFLYSCSSPTGYTPFLKIFEAATRGGADCTAFFFLPKKRRMSDRTKHSNNRSVAHTLLLLLLLFALWILVSFNQLPWPRPEIRTELTSVHSLRVLIFLIIVILVLFNRFLLIPITV